LLGAAIALFLVILLRTLQAGRIPCQTTYDGLLWSASAALLAYLLVERGFNNIHTAGFPVAGIAAAVCIHAALGCNPAIEPPPPTLQSAWFAWRIVVTSISYAVFVVAFALESAHVTLVGLLPHRMLEHYRIEPDDAARFHRAAHRLALLGFPLLTLGLVAGAVWTEQTWGRSWSWSPKETWSLGAWTAYAAYLHAMTMPGWRGGWASALNMLGFACIMMALLGGDWLARLFAMPGLPTS
jgi:ABC-type transport system involved in cytochrome c biogenesis permease subunit